jgi:hypothetical protein
MVHCAEYAVKEWVLRQGPAIDRAIGDNAVTEDEIAVYFQDE